MAKLISFLTTFFLTAIISTSYAAQPLDRIIAQVNNSVVTQSELDNAIKMEKAQLAQLNKPIPDNKILREQVLNRLIDNKLELQIAERAKIKISDEQLDKAIADIANKNHVTVAQLKEALAQQGINYQNYRQQIREQITISEVQRGAIAQELTITDQEIQAFLNSPKGKNTAGVSYHLIDALIPLNDNATTEQIATAKTQAEKIAKEWRSGTNINELQAQNTDLGMRTISDLPGIFASAITILKVGDISSPIKAPNGFHILKLIGKEGSTQLTPQQAREILFQEKFKNVSQAWLKKVRSAAYIKIMQ